MTIEDKIKLFASIISLLAIGLGAFQFLRTQSIEAKRPYLEKKLAWCERAIESAASIAVSQTPTQDDLRDFAKLYWGKMGLIENGNIEQAMKQFAAALPSSTERGIGKTASGSPHLVLQSRALDLAHACRAELAWDWSSSWARP